MNNVSWSATGYALSGNLNLSSYSGVKFELTRQIDSRTMAAASLISPTNKPFPSPSPEILNQSQQSLVFNVMHAK